MMLVLPRLVDSRRNPTPSSEINGVARGDLKKSVYENLVVLGEMAWSWTAWIDPPAGRSDRVKASVLNRHGPRP